jgi:hypothetical protein
MKEREGRKEGRKERRKGRRERKVQREGRKEGRKKGKEGKGSTQTRKKGNLYLLHQQHFTRALHCCTMGTFIH